MSKRAKVSEQLRKAVNDARAMGDALGRLGFEVLRGENLGRQALVDKLDDIAQRLDQDIRLADRFFMHEWGTLLCAGSWTADQTVILRPPLSFVK